MKYILVVTLLVFISCGQSANEKKTTTSESNNTKPDTIVQQMKDTVDKKDVSPTFDEVMALTKTKPLPHIDMTNFDDYIDPDDVNEIHDKVLSIEAIYPNFYHEGFNYRAMSSYKLKLSKNYNTLVVTYQKGDHEMKSTLINYDLEGNIIDHQLVAYDEIAESMSRLVSRISENTLAVHHIFWSHIREIEEIQYKILSDGSIEKIGTRNLNDSFENFTFINSILMDLKLDWVQIKTNLIATQEHPNSPDETIVVIPEIVDEGEQYFNLNSHIVIADNRSGKMTNNYFEGHQTNEWVSDAIELDGIQIDTIPYQVSENKVAFGLNVSHFGHSRVNPFQNKTLSLFVQSGDSLLKVLSNYTVENYGGERNGDCEGEFIDEKKTIWSGTTKTNGYFDLLVNNKITETKDYDDKNGECQTKETVDIKNAILKFNGKTYIETDAETKLYSEFHPQKLENIQIENFDVDHAYQLGGFKIISGNYKAEEGKHFAPDTETETDWGDRLLMLDASNNLVFRSQGIGDAYLYEPHFYKSSVSNKIMIICQKAYEYPFGGEAFILENEKIKHIGTLDIEGDDEEKYLTEVIEINEMEDCIVFALKANEVILKPGSEDTVKMNQNVIYVYRDNELVLKTNNHEF